MAKAKKHAGKTPPNSPPPPREQPDWIDEHPKGLRPPQRRAWRSKLPVPVEDSWAPGAKRHLPDGELMLNALLRSAAWQEIWEPAIGAVELEWGPLHLWSFRDLVRIELAGIENRQWYSARLRDWLTGDRARRTREQLNLLEPRMDWRPDVKNSLNVPSEATLSRYYASVPWEPKAQLMRLTFERLRDEGVALIETIDPGLNDITFWDGYDVFITGKPASDGEPPAGATRKHRRVEGAGRVGRRTGHKPGGPGFKISDVCNQLALPLLLEVGPIDQHDKTAAIDHRLVDQLARVLVGTRLRVAVADPAYWGDDFLTLLPTIGFVPCIHHASHKGGEKTEEVIAKKDTTFTRIEGTNWWINGHNEFFCDCGAGTTAIDIELGRNGRALIRTDARCAGCGNESFTAGRYSTAQNPPRISKHRDLDPKERRPGVGNPLTYNSYEAREYGRDRFGYNESFHGQLQAGYGLGGSKTRLPVQSQAHLAFRLYAVGALMWANAFERLHARGARRQAA